MTEFIEFPKMARLSRECVITEKIDGTNACVYIGDDGEFLTGSRTRWITPTDDNYGFSVWAHQHREEIIRLGPGQHFGEWWGSGIQRKYGKTGGEKTWSLFNTIRWCLPGTEPQPLGPNTDRKQGVLPLCCSLVPVIYRGVFDTKEVEESLERLATHGSYASPGFMRPEGVVVYHIAAGVGFKKTIEKDAEWKGRSA